MPHGEELEHFGNYPLEYTDLEHTKKSFKFVSKIFRSLTTLDMFVDTSSWILSDMQYYYIVNKYFVGIINLWIALSYEIHEIKCPININDFTVCKKINCM